MSVITARGVHKRYGDTKALNGFDLTVEPGRIVGLIGPNGSGKTTALKALLGLNTIDGGSLTVCDRNPQEARAELMQDVAYIADTGILPRWMKAADLIDYMEGVHPRFDRQEALANLERTDVQPNKRIHTLSKGMHVQLHLALILAIDVKLLVLDEPTLGLDILYRQRFYDAVLNDYFTEDRSILVTTHEVREIEHILTDVVFIDHGKARLSVAMERLKEEYVKVTTAEPLQIEHSPLSQNRTINGVEQIFHGVPRNVLADYGDTATPNLAELFVAIVENSMHSFIALIKRQWHEQHAPFLWAPAVMLLLLVLVGVGSAVVDVDVDSLDAEEKAQFEEHFTPDQNTDVLSGVASMVFDVAGSTDKELSYKLLFMNNIIAHAFYFVLTIVMFFALLACLHDERKDRSILFWKSMPVSDTQTVASKLVFIVWVAPLLTLAAIVLAQLFATLLTSLAAEEGLAMRVWGASPLFSGTAELVLGMLIQGVWSLPIYAWLLLISVWANKMPVLWALGVPWVVSLVERIFLDTNTVGAGIANHLRFAALPKSGGDGDAPVHAAEQLGLFLQADLWIGVLVGGALLAATVYFRKTLNEI